jgi:hypothetical protein
MGNSAKRLVHEPWIMVWESEILVVEPWIMVWESEILVVSHRASAQ